MYYKYERKSNLWSEHKLNVLRYIFDNLILTILPLYVFFVEI
jgi:hypothetical protein